MRATNMELAVEEWAEKGRRPRDRATRLRARDPAKGVKMTRPLWPYPQVAKYKGSGDHDAGIFLCEAR